MSIYNSNADNSSFSLLGNNTQLNTSRSSKGSRGGRSGKSSRSSNLLNTTATMGSNQVPDVVGLTRLEAIDLLIAEGFDYIVSYTTASATSQNNDIVSSQYMADFVVVLTVYQYTAPLFAYSYLLDNNISNYYWRYFSKVFGQQGPAELEAIRTGNKEFTVSGISGQYSSFNGLTGTLSWGGFAYINNGNFGQAIIDTFGAGAAFNYQTRFPGITFNWN